MTPTPAQIGEWRESGCNAFILDSEVSLGTCGAQAYVYGYIRARTVQATEIAELKAKLAEPLAPITADMVTDEMALAYQKLCYECESDDDFIAKLVNMVNAWGAKQ
jgi:hypothetical protein